MVYPNALMAKHNAARALTQQKAEARIRLNRLSTLFSGRVRNYRISTGFEMSSGVGTIQLYSRKITRCRMAAQLPFQAEICCLGLYRSSLKNVAL